MVLFFLKHDLSCLPRQISDVWDRCLGFEKLYQEHEVRILFSFVGLTRESLEAAGIGKEQNVPANSEKMIKWV